MRTSRLVIALGLFAAISAGNALAQDATTRVPSLQQPASIQQVAYSDYLAYMQDGVSESPSDAPPAVVEEPAAVADVSGGCGCADTCGDTCGACEPVCGRGCRRRCCCRTEIGGWFSAGYYTNAYGAGGNGPLGFNNIGDEFTVNQMWIYAAREADTGGCGTDWGYHIDFLFGTDGPDTTAFGDGSWDTTWNTTTEYGFAMPQLYGEVAINDWTIKFGHFYTIIGYEVVQAPDNFFYSHAYTMYYAEPFTHTGVLASYALNDRVTVHGGWTNGWDCGFDNRNEGSTFLGGINVDISDRASLAWATTFGKFGIGAGDIYMNSIVFSYDVSCRLKYVLQHDLGVNGNLGAGNNEWYGINQYIQYEINDCWAAGMRIEWFRDDDGTRVITGPPGNAGNYFALTAGLNWKPRENFVMRPEIRYDTYDGTIGADGAPFGNGNHCTQLSGGFDFILTF